MQIVAAALKRITGGKARSTNVSISQPNGGRKMVVTVGRVQSDITMSVEDIREMEKILGASRRKREALMAWLRRKSRKLVATGVREELVELDRALQDWYEVVEMDVEENIEVKAAAPGSDPAADQGQEAGGRAEQGAGGSGEAEQGEGSRQEQGQGGGGRQRQGQGEGSRAEQGQGEEEQGRQQGKGGGGREEQGEAGGSGVQQGRSRRGAAMEASQSMEESFDKGELSFSKEESASFKKPSRKRKKSQERAKKQKEKKQKVQGKGAKKKKKKKKMKMIVVKKPLVYVTNVPAFLEMIRLERGLTAEETMIRIGIDAGQGSLKVVANMFSK